MKLIVLIATVPNEGKNPLQIKATQGNIEHTPTLQEKPILPTVKIRR